MLWGFAVQEGVPAGHESMRPAQQSQPRRLSLLSLPPSPWAASSSKLSSRPHVFGAQAKTGLDRREVEKARQCESNRRRRGRPQCMQTRLLDELDAVHWQQYLTLPRLRSLAYLDSPVSPAAHCQAQVVGGCWLTWPRSPASFSRAVEDKSTEPADNARETSYKQL